MLLLDRTRGVQTVRDPVDNLYQLFHSGRGTCCLSFTANLDRNGKQNVDTSKAGLTICSFALCSKSLFLKSDLERFAPVAP